MKKNKPKRKKREEKKRIEKERKEEQKENEIQNEKKKKEKEIIIEKNFFLEFVYLTEKEYQTLIEKHGEIKTKELIEILNNAIGAKGYKYKSHYYAINGWVMKEYNKNHINGNNKTDCRPGFVPVKQSKINYEIDKHV